MINKRIIIIPTIEKTSAINKYVENTAKTLIKNNNLVYIFSTSHKRKKIKNLPKNFKLIKKLENNLYLVIPFLIIPMRFKKYFPNEYSYQKICDNICIYLLKIIIFFKSFKFKKGKILWMFFPHLFHVIETFNLKKWLLIYDAVDFHQENNSDLVFQKKYLLNKTNITTAISFSLRNELIKIQKKQIPIIPQGFSAPKNNINQKINMNKKRQVIGFVGELSGRLDVNLINNLVNNNPKIIFYFIGPITNNSQISITNQEKLINLMLKHKNIKYLSSKPQSDLFKIIQTFNIAIIPYNINFKFNKLCYPTKIFEYFYMGKPVISTPIEELKRFPKFVKIGNTAEEWTKILKKLLAKPWPETYKKQQRELAINNSWENKIKAISKIIEKHEKTKNSSRHTNN